MTRFKWYRKLVGGVWFCNRYNYTIIGGPLIIKWERQSSVGTSMSSTIKTEVYD